jgi:hypothetical protein
MLKDVDSFLQTAGKRGFAAVDNFAPGGALL